MAIPVFGEAPTGTGTENLDVNTLTTADGANINAILNDATGNEIALDLQYTTNKASSGNDTGLVVNQTDTASPGTSLLADFQTGGTSKFKVTNAGALTTTGQIQGTKILAASNAVRCSWVNPGTAGAFQYGSTITKFTIP